MKHCNYCNVNVEDRKVHCPLCGKCIDEEKVKLGIKNHSDIYPDYTINKDMTKLICRLVARSLFILTIISICVDLFVKQELSFSLIVLLSFLCSYFAIITPIRKKMSIDDTLIRLAIASPIALYLMELLTKSFGWGICIVEPSISMGISVACLVLMSVSNFMDYDMLKPLILNGSITLLLLILLIIFDEPTLISIIAFLINLGIVLFVVLFKFKKATKSINKSFRF